MALTKQEAMKKYQEMQERMAQLDAEEKQLSKPAEPERDEPIPLTRDEAMKKYQEMQERMAQLDEEESYLKNASGTDIEDENHSLKEHLSELSNAPDTFMTSFVDTASAPFRAISEKLLGAPETPTLTETRQSDYQPKTKTGKLSNTAAELSGEVAGYLPWGTAAVGAGNTLLNVGKLGTKIPKALKFIGDYGLGAIPQTAQKAARLAKIAGAGAGVSSGLQHISGWDPLAANLFTPTSLASKLLASRVLHNIPTPKKSAAKSLKKTLGDEETEKVLMDIEGAPEGVFPEGYKPTTTEYSQNPTLIALERAHYATNPNAINQSAENVGVLRKSVNNLAPADSSFTDTLTHANQAKTNQQSLFDETIAIAEANRAKGLQDIKAPQNVSHQKYGEDLRGGLEKTVAQHEKARTAASKPLYTAMKQSQEMVDVAPTYKTMKMFSEEGVQGASKADMSAVHDALKSQTEKGMSPEIKSLIESLQKENANPELIASILEQAGVHPSKASAGQIHNVMTSIIDPRMTQAAKAKDWGRYRNLQYVKESLHDALEVVPEFSEAQKTYREMSKPINAIMRDPGLGPILKTDVYKTANTTRAATHLDKFIYGKSSEENAGALVKSLSKDKKTLQEMRDYTRHEFVNDVVDATTGEIDIKRINHWRKNNQGAFKLDPELAQHAKNLESSQIALHQIAKSQKVTTQQTKAVFDALLEKDAPIVIRGILSSPKSNELMKGVITLAKNDPTGKSLEGLKRGVADHIGNTLSLAAQTTQGEYNLSFNALRGMLERSGSPLRELYGKDGFANLQKVFNSLKSINKKMTAGSAVGSPTESYQQLVSLLSDSAEPILTSMVPTQLGRNIARLGTQGFKDAKKKHILDFIQNPESFKEAMRKAAVDPLKKMRDEDTTKEISRSALLSFLNG